MTGHAAPEDFEEVLEVGGGAGAVDDGEGAGAEGGGEFAGVVAHGAAAFDDDGRGRGGEAGEELEEADAGFFGAGLSAEGEGEVDDGDVDGVVGDDLLGGIGGAGDVGADAHGFEHAREALGPGVGLVAGAGEEEVESASGWGGRVGTGALEGARVVGMVVVAHHGREDMGKGRAELVGGDE